MMYFLLVEDRSDFEREKSDDALETGKCQGQADQVKK
jgi:hypothetical protein